VSGATKLFVELNPLYQMIEIVRAPLLGGVPPLATWAATLGVTAAGWRVTFFVRLRERIACWI
jgi:ABC-type polysaccharide/polyol phosphate export permease